MIKLLKAEASSDKTTRTGSYHKVSITSLPLGLLPRLDSDMNLAGVTG